MNLQSINIFGMYLHISPEKNRSPGLFLKERREKEMPRLLAPLNKILQKQSFITGDKLTVADIAIASYLYYAQLLLSLDFSKYPAVVTYLL
ncbi:MAG: glutathione S-transferase C-terminal domain-containing protein [Cyanobacteria bacterium J06636_27]